MRPVTGSLSARNGRNTKLLQKTFTYSEMTRTKSKTDAKRCASGTDPG